MTKNDLEFIFSIPEVFPVPIGRPGRPDEIASLLAYLLSPDAGFFCGSGVFADGGTDAAVRTEDYPTPRAGQDGTMPEGGAAMELQAPGPPDLATLAPALP